LKSVGITVVAIAIAGACAAYWRGKAAEQVFDDPSMGAFNKANQRQMEIMYGKMGTVTEDLVQQLKQPGTQAVLILIGGGLIAAGCFYLARLVSYGDEESKPAERGTNPP
jgi:hypothetical protein